MHTLKLIHFSLDTANLEKLVSQICVLKSFSLLVMKPFLANSVNPFVLNASFLYPLKTLENLTVF